VISDPPLPLGFFCPGAIPETHGIMRVEEGSIWDLCRRVNAQHAGIFPGAWFFYKILSGRTLPVSLQSKFQ
jgi:hypothetical protein